MNIPLHIRPRTCNHVDFFAIKAYDENLKIDFKFLLFTPNAPLLFLPYFTLFNIDKHRFETNPRNINL